MRLREEKGFTLIEVLVAILIVGVGVLGVAGMQVVSLQQNRNALFRDTGLQLANDIIDRMRANNEISYGPVAFEDAPSFSVNCLDAPCNPTEMSEFDLAQWKCRLNPLDSDGALFPACGLLFDVDPADPDAEFPAAALPGGRGSISGTDVNEVRVEWITDRDGNVSQVILSARILRPST